MKRYDKIIEKGFPDSCAIMYSQPDGEFIKYSDHEEKVKFAVDVLTNLKNCKVSLNSPEELNMIVDKAIEELEK